MKELFLGDFHGSLNKSEHEYQREHFNMYKSIRDGKFDGLRKALNEIYNIYFEYLGDSENSFKNQAVQNIEAVIWHLGLLKYLEQLGFTLLKAKPQGPDIICIKGNRKYLIEVVTCSVGENYSNIPIHLSNLMAGPPDRNGVKLRLSTALDNKASKIEEYYKQGIIEEEDVVVVAINSCRIYDSRLPGENNRDLMENLLFESNVLRKNNGEEFDYCFFKKHPDTRINVILYSCIDIASYILKREHEYGMGVYANPILPKSSA